jgi:carboxypeptidase family protein
MTQAVSRASTTLAIVGLTSGAMLVAGSCTHSKDPASNARPPLDQRLKSGEVRAGIVASPSEMIGGPASKARLGDYKIYNSKIQLIISQLGDARGYQPYGGIVIDADRVRPEGEPGKSSYGEMISALDLSVMKPTSIEVVNDGRSGGEARIRIKGEEGVMPLFDSLFQNLFTSTIIDVSWDVDYALRADADALEIDFMITNRGKPPVEVGLPIVAFFAGAGAPPFMRGYGFVPATASNFAEYYANVGEEVSYIFGRPDAPMSIIVQDSGVVVAGNGEGFKLVGHETKKITQYLVVGDGDLSKTQDTWRKLQNKLPGLRVLGHVVDSKGTPIAGAHVHVVEANPAIADRDYVTRAKTDVDGSFSLALDPGGYEAVVQGPARVVSETKPLTVTADGDAPTLDFTLGVPGTITYLVLDDQGRKLPVKISVAPENGEVRQLPLRYGEKTLSYNLATNVFATAGEGQFSLPPGDYAVYASRGAEYEIAEKHVTVPSGGTLALNATLERSVKTDGWLSTDTHVHAQLSPDSLEGYPEKVAAMVTEGLEIPVSTDHEAIGDFNPYIRQLGVGDWMQGVVGSEITTFTYGHFNAFPLVADPSKPGNGRISWYQKTPAETFKAIRANAGDPFLQVNHPRSLAIGGYFSAMGFDPEKFVAARPADFSTDFDGIEVANGCDVHFIESQTMPDWFGFLNRGIKKFATGSTDNHHSTNGEMGFPRTYVAMPTDDPKAAVMEDVRASMKAGRMIVTCGPFIEFTADGGRIGDTVKMGGDTLEIQARVAAPSWMDVDQLEIVLNGKTVQTIALDPSTARGSERFHDRIWIRVSPGKDAWVILKARGDTAHGVWARNRPSFAFTNAIFLDGNQDGVWLMQ